MTFEHIIYIPAALLVGTIFGYTLGARAVRREQPFMQARAVIIAIQIRMLEWKMRERVRAVHYDFDSALAAQTAYSLYGKYLPRQVSDVTDQYDFCAGRYGALEPLV